MKKVENGQTTYYLRGTALGGQVVAELNASGAWQRGYVYNGGQLLAVQSAGGVSWQHEDPITKAKKLTGAGGAVTSATQADPWGGELGAGWQQNSAQQRRKYTTYERDAHGRDDALMRQYSGWYARFSQPDPYDGAYDLTDPQTFNRYAYVGNDPINFTDPTGLNAVSPGYRPPDDPGRGVGVFSPGIHVGYLQGYFVEASPWLPVLIPYTYFVGGAHGGGGSEPQQSGAQNTAPTAQPSQKLPGCVFNVVIAHNNLLSGK